MNIFYICLLLAVNFVTTIVTYYRKCYEEFCLITNNDDSSSESRFRLNQLSADEWCKRNSSSLAIITNANVQSAIGAFINDPSAKLNSDVITNGYRHNLNYWEWISGGRAVKANYPYSKHNDHRYGYLLVSGRRVATLNASIPSFTRNFICTSLTHYSSCPNDHLQFHNSCYKIHNNKEANWFEARYICLQEGYDLATFEYIRDLYLSNISRWLYNGEYWIGLHRERWYWYYGQTLIEIKYSNWDTYSPYAGGGDCLCLTANTGKWKECDCYQEHRYICIQDYTPDSSTAPVSTTTLLTTDTTATTRTDPSSAPTTTRIPTTTTKTDANFVTTVVTYYRKCYKEFSVCLITNTDDQSSSESRFRLSRASADDWCKRNSSSLAIITNASVQFAIEAFINDSSAKLNSDVITNGIRSQVNYWEWINGRRSANYPSSERSYYHYGYLQVSTRSGATLKAGYPTTKRNFICSHLSHNSNCPDGHHRFGSSCYKIHNSETANWFDARNLCLQEGYDLATFEDIDLSSISGLPDGEYWIGLRSERWNWFYGQKPAAINYSKWDNISPNAIGDNCLCLTASTGKWRDCSCSQKHRYICTEDYTSDSSAAPASTTTLLTIDTIATRTDPSSAPTTTRITTSTTQTNDDSTLITTVDDSNKQPDDSRMFLIIGLGIACLLILIAATAVVVHVRTRRCSSHDPGPSCDAPSATTVTNADAPNTVYAEIMPSTSESTRSPSEWTANQIVYAELDLIPKGNKDGKALQELEYANSIQLNSVYARCAHTRV